MDHVEMVERHRARKRAEEAGFAKK